ncbi:MAG: hypothetical protein KAV87_43275 [Desulfobacteraceae bacterium]|nr:hypothetical protein [Desulfobacteraceae bacterium]
MGRPKKYTPEFIEGEAKALLEYAQSETIPFKKDFAVRRGYPSENLSRWAKENDEFYQALKRMEDVQETKLVKAMLMKKVDVTAAIFTLKNVAGWRDKRSTEFGVDDGTRRLLQGALAKLKQMESK